MPCSLLSMLDSLSGTNCAGVRFPVERGWNGRDVSRNGMYDYVKECVSFIM